MFYLNEHLDAHLSELNLHNIKVINSLRVLAI